VAKRRRRASTVFVEWQPVVLQAWSAASKTEGFKGFERVRKARRRWLYGVVWKVRHRVFRPVRPSIHLLHVLLLLRLLLRLLLLHLLPRVIELRVRWCGVRRSNHRLRHHQRQTLVSEDYSTRGRRAVVVMRNFNVAQTFPRGQPSLRGVWRRARRQHALDIVIGDGRRRR
jgi:hypothetical protein